MKKLLSFLLFLSISGNLLAEEKGFIGVGAVGAYNKTWEVYGGIDVIGGYQFTKHFEANAAMEYLTPNVFSLTVHAIPKIVLWRGEGFLDGSVHFKEYGPYDIYDFVMSLSAGYRMNHINLQIGIMGHVFGGGGRVWEPVNLLYRGELRLMRDSSKWNIAAGGGNYTEFEYERTWEPMYFARGWVDLTDRMGLNFRVDLKPAGAFHMNAKFWGCAVRAGVKFKF